DERERGERERGDVQGPAREADQEPDDPRPVPEQRAQRAYGMAQRQRRQLLCRIVLLEPPPVERERRDQCQREPRADCHLRSLWNGRYASAASAAIPTRGRSRRRS